MLSGNSRFLCVCERERGWRVETFVCVKDGGRDRVIAGRYRRPRATRHHLTRGASYDPAQVKVEDLLCALLSRSHWIIRYRYWGLKANMIDDIVFVVHHTVFISTLVWLHQNIQYLLSAEKPENGGKCFKFFSFLTKFFPPVKEWRQDDLI